VVESTAEKIMPLLRQKKLKLDIAIADDLALVAVRESTLRKLALGLLENACRASPPDGTVLVRAEMVTANGNGPKAGREVALTVTDSGAGINPDDRERVFSSPANSGNERPVVGLGGEAGSVGLIRKLAQTSGGDLNFEGAADQGTTFTLRLPAADVQPWTLLKVTPAGKAEEPAQKNAPAGERG
jgi:signal transduction histidine kinase